MSRADQLGMAPQVDLDTTASAVAFSPPVTAEDIEIDREDLEIDETLGTRAPAAQEYGGRIFNGNVEGAIRPKSSGIVFTSFWGDPVSDQPASVTDPTVYQHVWDPIVNDPRPITIWTVNNDPKPDPIIDKYVGALGSELTLTCEANDYYLFEAEYLAKSIVGLTPPAPSMTRDTTGKWPFHQVTAQLAVGSGSYSTIKLREFEMSYDNNLEDDQFVLGSQDVDSIPIGNIECEVSFTPTQDIEAHYRRSLADSPTDVRLKLTALGPIISNAYRYKLELEFHRLQTVEAPVEIDGEDPLRDVEVTANAVLNESTDKLITATLVNTYAGTDYTA